MPVSGSKKKGWIYADVRPRRNPGEINPDRVRMLREAEIRPAPIVYWMGREQRVRDNWALLFAQSKALDLKAPLLVVFCLTPRFLEAAWRQYAFMLQGLKGVERDLRELAVPFHVLAGPPESEIPSFVRARKAGFVVTDFDPLRIKRSWRGEVARGLSVPLAVVDSRNIIPCWAASQKQEYAAHTLRRKVARLLPGYVETVPAPKRHPFGGGGQSQPVRWDALEKSLQVDRSVAPVDRPEAGEKAARKRLQVFLREGLARYAAERNDPNAGLQSGLSPYLHFGQLSSLRAALEVLGSGAPMESKEAFLEELITRRELADNYCWYNPHYDDPRGFPAWAVKTLEEHGRDPRDPRYTRKRLEAAHTHDPLWNAAQRELMELGTMPGYLRMYWAKKILEWSGSAGEAMEAAVYLNDRYQLDGRDPNGYAGIAWSVGGVHDRPWFERPIFGKIRTMTLNGCRSKFDVDAYIARVDAATAAAPAATRTPAEERRETPSGPAAEG